MKEQSEQSLWFVGLYALMLAWLGGLLGFICLMLFPLQAYPDMEARAKVLEARESSYTLPGDAFYLEGTVSRSPGWADKRQQLIDASESTIQISAADVNAWLNAKFASVATANGDEKGIVLLPERPNVAIAEEGTIYLNLPSKITGYGLDGNYVLSARVRYREGAPARLIVEHVQIAGAVVPLPRLIGARIVSTIIRGFSSAEEYGLLQDAWSRVHSVKASDGMFVLRLDRR